jgi:hypothetical protein
MIWCTKSRTRRPVKEAEAAEAPRSKPLTVSMPGLLTFTQQLPSIGAKASALPPARHVAAAYAKWKGA